MSFANIYSSRMNRLNDRIMKNLFEFKRLLRLNIEQTLKSFVLFENKNRFGI